MSRISIATQQRVYFVSPDDLASAAARLRALIVGKAIDELTGGPPRARMQIAVQERRFHSRVSTNNQFIVSGIPLQHFPFLATQNYQLHLDLRADGFIPMNLTADITMTPLFPAVLPSVKELGDVSLHREPVRIGGRVMRRPPNSAPIVGAAVRVTGVWTALPPPNTIVPSEPANVLGVRAPIYSACDPTTAVARPVTLTPVAGQDKRLRAKAASGVTSLSLNNRVGLNMTGGDLLWIDSGTSAEEFIKTTGVQGSSSDKQAAQAHVENRLNHAHNRDAVVKMVSIAPAGPAKSFARPAIPGDAVIFLTDLTGWAGAVAVEINHGASTEYHALLPFTATTDAEGFYRLPPISRIAIVELEARETATAVKLIRSIDYMEPVNQTDFQL